MENKDIKDELKNINETNDYFEYSKDNTSDNDIFNECHDEEMVCWECNKKLSDDEVNSYNVSVVDAEKFDGIETLYFCMECYKKYVIKCEECGKIFYSADEIPCEHQKYYTMKDIAYEQLENKGMYKEFAVIPDYDPNLIKKDSENLREDTLFKLKQKLRSKDQNDEKIDKDKLGDLVNNNFISRIQALHGSLISQTTQNVKILNNIFDIFSIFDIVFQKDVFFEKVIDDRDKYTFNISEKYFILKLFESYNTCIILKELKKIKKKRKGQFDIIPLE